MQLYLEKSSGTVFQMFSKILRKTYFEEHVRMGCLSEMNQKNCIHKIYLQENNGDGVLFGLHHRYFFHEKFYRTMCTTASVTFDLSFALSVINQCSHSIEYNISIISVLILVIILISVNIIISLGLSEKRSVCSENI